MSAADEAYDDWRELTRETLRHPDSWPAEQAAFMAGYVRALEDAADALEKANDLPALPKWLRNRAAAADPCEHFWNMGEAMAVDTCTKCGAWRDQYDPKVIHYPRETKD